MLSFFQSRWQVFDPSVRLQLLNAGVFALTIDGGIQSVLLNLYMLRLGFGPELVGQVVFVGQLAFALSCLPAGRIGERWNLRHMMTIGLLLVLLGSAMVPLTEFFPQTVHIAWMIVANAIMMIGLAGYYANQAPYVIGLSHSQSRTAIFSVQSAFYAVFGFIGSLLGGILPGVIAQFRGQSLEESSPYAVTLWLVPLFMLVALRLIFWMKDATNTHEVIDTPSSSPGAPGAPAFLSGAIGLIVIMSIIRFLQVGGVGTATTFFNVYLDDQLGVSTERIGWILAISKLLGVPAALAVPLVTRRLGNAGTTIVASAIVVAAIMPIAFVPVWWVAGIGYILCWSVTPMRYSAFLVYIMEHCPPQLRGSMNGAGEMAAGLSFATVSLIGGYMIASYGYLALFVTGALLTLAGTLLFWGYVTLWKK